MTNKYLILFPRICTLCKNYSVYFQSKERILNVEITEAWLICAFFIKRLSGTHISWLHWRANEYNFIQYNPLKSNPPEYFKINVEWKEIWIFFQTKVDGVVISNSSASIFSSLKGGLPGVSVISLDLLPVAESD